VMSSFAVDHVDNAVGDGSAQPVVLAVDVLATFGR